MSKLHIRLVCLLAVLLQATTVAVAQQVSLYNFLRNDASARAAALGGAFVAMPDDGSAVFYNPASVFTTPKKRLTSTFLKHVLDINSGFASYHTDLSALGDEQGMFAIGVNYVNYGSFERADRNGIVSGTFGGFDIALSATYSNLIDENFSYGVTAKIISNRLETAGSSALAFDVGFLYQIPEKRTNIGLSFLNNGFQLSSFGTDEEHLPADVQLGVNHRLRGLPVLLNFAFTRLLDETDTFTDRFMNFAIGGEIYFGKYVQARVGYNHLRRTSLASEIQRRLAGLSAGVGIVLEDFQFDYSINSLGTAGNNHRFTLHLDL